jgi:hypothetical protein
VDPRAGLDNMEKWKFLTLPELETQPLSRPARSSSSNSSKKKDKVVPVLN